jgi:dTMP kinase
MTDLRVNAATDATPRTEDGETGSLASRIVLQRHHFAGRLIVVEGTDGAGKSTLIAGLTDQLQARGHDVLTTFQPTTGVRSTDVFRAFSESGSGTRAEYRALYLVTLGDRLYHCLSTIEPHLRAGGTVLCDRYIFTTLANIIARQQTMEAWFVDAVSGILEPDLAVLVHCPVEIAYERIRERPEEKDRPVDLAHMTRVHDGFRDLEGAGLLRGIDTSSATPEETRAVVATWLDELDANRAESL